MKTNTTTAAAEAARNIEIYNKLADIAREVFNHLNGTATGKTYTPADIARAIVGGPVVREVNRSNYELDRVEPYAIGGGLTWAEGYDPATVYELTADNFTCKVTGWRVWDVLDRAARAWSIPAARRATFERRREVAPVVASFSLSTAAARELVACCAKDELRPVMEGVQLDTRRRVLVATDGHVLRVMQLGEALAVTPEAAPSYIIPVEVIKSGRVVTIDANGVASTDKKSAETIAGRYPNYMMVIPTASEAARVALTADQWKQLKKAVAEVAKVHPSDKYTYRRVIIAHERYSDKLHVYAYNYDFNRERETIVTDIDTNAPEFSISFKSDDFARIGGAVTALYVTNNARAIVATDPAGLSLVMPLTQLADDKYYYSFNIEATGEPVALLPGHDIAADAADIKKEQQHYIAAEFVKEYTAEHDGPVNLSAMGSEFAQKYRFTFEDSDDARRVLAEVIGDTLTTATTSEAIESEPQATGEAVESVESVEPADTKAETSESHSEPENEPQGDTIEAPEAVEVATADPETIDTPAETVEPQGESLTPADRERIAAEVAESIARENETPEAVASRRPWFVEGRAVTFYDIESDTDRVGLLTCCRYVGAGEWLADVTAPASLVFVGVSAGECHPVPASPVELTPATVRAIKTAAKVYLSKTTTADDLEIYRAQQRLNAEGLRLAGHRVTIKATGETVARVRESYNKAGDVTRVRVVFPVYPESLTTDPESVETPADIDTTTATTCEAIAPEVIESEPQATGETVEIVESVAPDTIKADTCESHSEAENVAPVLFTADGDTFRRGDRVIMTCLYYSDRSEVVGTLTDKERGGSTAEVTDDTGRKFYGWYAGVKHATAETIAEAVEVAPVWASRYAIACELPTADGIESEPTPQADTLTPPPADTIESEGETVAPVLTIERPRHHWHPRRAVRVALRVAALIAAALLLTLTPDRVETIEAETVAPVAIADTLRATGEAVESVETVAPDTIKADTCESHSEPRKHATGHRPDRLAPVAPADTIKADTIAAPADLLTIEAVELTADTLTADTIATAQTIEGEGEAVEVAESVEGEPQGDTLTTDTPETIEATGEAVESAESPEGDPATTGTTGTPSPTSTPATGGTPSPAAVGTPAPVPAAVALALLLML